MVTAALAVPSMASAAEQNAYAAAMSYATPAVTIAAGDTVTFHNLDTLAKHDIVGHEGGFASELIGAGESSPVKGVEKLEPGQYPFHCSLHSWMQGAITVTQGGAGAPSPTAPGDVTGLPLVGTTPDPADIWPRASRSSIGSDRWPLYGGDISNTRNGGLEGPSATEALNLGVAWSFHAPDGDFTGTPVVARGMVVAGSNGGTVYALDAATGERRWLHSVGKEPINGSLATDGKRVYVPVADTHEPKVMALSLKTGKHLWTTRVSSQKDSDVYGSPVVWKGTVFIGVSALFGELNDPDVAVRGQVVALGAKKGKIKWNTYTVPKGYDGASVWTTPAIDPATKRLYVGTGNAYHHPVADTTDSILALSTRTGRIVQKFQATPGDVWNGTENSTAGPDYDFGASPQLFTGLGGRKLVGAGQKSGMYWALDRSTLRPVWNTQVGPGAQVGGIVGSTATDGQRIYGPSTVGGEEWALNMDGSLAWAAFDGGPLKFNPTAVANGVVWTGDMSGFLIAREASTGAPLARVPLGSPTWGGVSVAGGSVFVAIGTQGTNGYIAAYRARRGDELFQGADHWFDRPEQNADEYLAQQRAKKQRAKRKAAKQRAKRRGKKRRGSSKTKRLGTKCKRKGGKRKGGKTSARGNCPRSKKKRKKTSDQEDHGSGDDPHQQGRGGALLKANRERGDRYVPKPAGTTDRLSLYYGPYVIPPGWDANRVDLELPTQNGFLISLEPAMRRVADLSEPGHTEAHIHHAHWFGFDPGNEEDGYFNQTGAGTHEWVFGNGDEETRADFRRRSAAQPGGPIYGNFLPAARNQTIIYMLHNKTSQPMAVYIVLDVIFKHGTRSQLEAIEKRPYHDVAGMLMGRTLDVPRDAGGDGKWEYVKENKNCPEADKRAEGCAIEWVAPRDGTIVGSGGHLHPGGTQVTVENYGSPQRPCATDRRGRGYGGTLLLRSDVINRHAPLSEDYQTEVTHPAWRAPLRKGDRIRISGTYANKHNAWYTAMIHAGFYFDYEQPPKRGCKPYIVGPSKKKVKDPTEGVPNRDFGEHEDDYCGEAYGKPACEKPEQPPAETAFVNQNLVHIANFQYLPGDRSASTAGGNIPSVRQGQKITFVNEDQFANIRHSVTTCPWPCNGRYVSNYPHADGAWDSGTLGYDVIDGGSPNPLAETPADLNPGLYTYFCRIHPWMRGAFRIEPPG